MQPEQKQYFGRDLEAMFYARNYSQWILDEIRPFVGYNVAEVGAGTGNFSKLLLKTGIKTLIAVEPSENMAAKLADNLKDCPVARVHKAFFGEISAQFEGQLDTVLYINVLEHIFDDRKELVNARRTLKSGGHICLFVPALSWLYSRFDSEIGHYRRYGFLQLKSLAESSGFEVVKSRYLDFLGIIPWYIVFVMMKRTLEAGHVKTYDSIIVPILRIVEKAVSFPIGKNILLVGRNPK